MSWYLILALAALVFFNRYIFLSPNVQIKLPSLIERMLSYSAPCLLAAICLPIIFFDGQSIREFTNNHYLYAAVLCVVLSSFKVKIIYNVMISLSFFYLIYFLF